MSADPHVRYSNLDDADLSELALLVQARLLREHAGCVLDDCPMRRLWIEDVAEIIQLAREEL